MEIRIELIDAEAITATNIRELKDIKTLVNDIKENGMYEAIKIGKLTVEEVEEAYNRRITKEKERQAAAAEAGKKTRPREIIKPMYGIIDGHTRYAAALKAKILTVKVEELQRRPEFAEKMYAYKANIARRDMEEWQKGEMIEAIKNETKKSVEEIAKEIGWSKAYGYKVLKKLKEHNEGTSAAAKSETILEVDYGKVDDIYNNIMDKVEDNKYKDTADKIQTIDDIKYMIKALRQITKNIAQQDDVKEHIKKERIAKLTGAKLKPNKTIKLKPPKTLKIK